MVNTAQVGLKFEQILYIFVKITEVKAKFAPIFNNVALGSETCSIIYDSMSESKKFITPRL